MSAQKYGPSISVCIATFNEGADLEATIALVYASKYKPHQVIVCDDNSEVDPSPRLQSWLDRDDFIYIRNPHREGSGRTKSNAMEKATGDLVIVLDSHMRPHYEWLNQIAEAHTRYPNSLLCTESTGFDQPHQGQFYGRGAYFDSNDPLKHGAHTVTWIPSAKLDKETYPRIVAMHGGCYIFPRYQLDRIGGYAPMLKGWGYEEEWVAMRAASVGIETRLIAGCPIQHQYKRSLHRRPAIKEGKPQGWEPYYNRHVVAIGAFGVSTWNRIYRQAIIEGTEPAMRNFVMEELQISMKDIVQWRLDYSKIAMDCNQWMKRIDISHPIPATIDQEQQGEQSPHIMGNLPENLSQAIQRPRIGGNMGNDIVIG